MRQPISDVVFAELRERIERGDYPVGEKLPTEQELCDALSVGRSSVREAMRMLHARGFVAIKRGSGTFVVSKDGNSPASIGRWLAENQDSITDYMSVRTAIECLSVRLFIARRDEAQMQKLVEIEKRFERAVEAGDVEGMVEGDESLHAAIAAATRNGLLISINKQLLDAFRQYRYVTFQDVRDRAEAVALHREIVSALSLRDTDRALLSMQKHLDSSLNNATRRAKEDVDEGYARGE